MTDIKVEGMHCPKCQKKVADALNSIRGAKADVDLEGGKATVICPENVSAEKRKPIPSRKTD